MEHGFRFVGHVEPALYGAVVTEQITVLRHKTLHLGQERPGHAVGKLLARPAVVAFSPRRGPLTACTRLWPEPETAAAFVLFDLDTDSGNFRWMDRKPRTWKQDKKQKSNQNKTKQQQTVIQLECDPQIEGNSLGTWPINWRLLTSQVTPKLKVTHIKYKIACMCFSAINGFWTCLPLSWAGLV